MKTTTMRAAVLYGQEKVQVEDISHARLGRGEVRVRIEAALTCGTDLKVFKRGYHAKMIVPPAVFGHEMAGVVTEVDPEAAGWATGDRVVIANSAPCGECSFCKGSQENLCEKLLFLNGAYAESIVVPERIVRRNLIRLGAATSFVDAALTEPLACVVQGVEDLKLTAGQKVLVIGSGPIGLMFAALARHRGCSVALAGRGATRLALASRLGANPVCEVPAGADWEKDLASGSGAPFDVVIEAVGRPEVWEAAVRLVRKGGSVNFFGGCPSGTTVSFDTGLIHYSNLTLLASFHHTPKTIRAALGYIESGVVRAADFVDGDCSLEDLPALLASMTRGNKAVKTLVKPQRG